MHGSPLKRIKIVPVTNVSVPVAVPIQRYMRSHFLVFSQFPFATAWIHFYGTPAPILDADRANAFSRFHSIQFSSVSFVWVLVCAHSLCLPLSLRVRVYAYCLELCSALVSRSRPVCLCVCIYGNASVYSLFEDCAPIFGMIYFLSFCRRRCLRTLHMPECEWVNACVCVSLLETHEIHPRTSIKGGTSAL